MGQVAYALLTRPPLSIKKIYRSFIPLFLARLACVRHAASVHPEPGSNCLFQFILNAASFRSLPFNPFSLTLFKRFLPFLFLFQNYCILELYEVFSFEHLFLPFLSLGFVLFFVNILRHFTVF